MSDSITVTIAGGEEAAAKMLDRRDSFDHAMLATMHQIVADVKTHVVSNHLSGPTGASSLSRISGNLARSVQTDVAEVAGGITGRVFYTGDVVYAAIHEFGGTIVPVNAKALRFMIGGKMVITQIVHMPERAPLRTGFREKREDIIAQLKGAVAQGLAP